MTSLRAGRRTNVALLWLLLAAIGTGMVAYAVGTTPTAFVIAVAHGAAGLGVVLLVPWKSVVVRRAARRASRGRWVVGVLLGVLAALAVAGGTVFALTGYRPVLGVTALAVHVGAGLALLPLLSAHAWRRRQRLRRVDVSRRNLLRTAGFVVGGAAAYGVLDVTALALNGRVRATGSHQVGSGDPDRMPVTQWFTDGVPALDFDTWQVSVGGRWVSYAELSAGTDVVRATIDCTGGWYAEQEWRGVRLERLVPAADIRSIDVVSATGYRRRLPARDATSLLLATHAAGAPLSAGHGGPVRLVAPGRRGFWWVKWVQRVEASREPWWLQSPFPWQ
ncbi:MAG: sulfite oxidase [Pseudonocardiales bacterium]|nr:MAG: sulfite oxidase [Pseudonocardiales bacterium]